MSREKAKKPTGQIRPKRKDSQHNEVLIHDTFLRLLHENKGRKPTLRELADATGLGFKTVQRHVDELVFEPLKDSMRVLTPDVITSLWKKSLAGNVPAIKLWLQVKEGWREAADIRHSNDPESPLLSPAMTTVINVREFVARSGEQPKNGQRENTADERDVH